MESIKAENTCGNLENTFVTIGIKLPNRNVEVVLANPCKDGVMSNSPSAKFPLKSVQAAFIEANDPLNVEEASLAVVPVIPRLS